MILKKIILSNISSYEGYNEFNFTVTDDKNVILIGGKNGAGKTSLFNAIKLGLYGPLNYNYQNVHAQYLAKIKDVINKKAFINDTVNAYITIGFDYIQEREKVYYEVTRTWTYINQKITETFKVKQNGKVLNDEELLFFENFLQTVLPPHLFTLFFFDGEELSDIFVGSRFNHYIKEAFLVLCNFDSFELIRKYCQNYVSRNNTSAEMQKISDDYQSAIDKNEKLLKIIDQDKLGLAKAKRTLEHLQIEKEDITNAFRNEGGLSEKEKKNLQAEIKKQDAIKEDNTYVIRSFLEEMHPFMILKDLSSEILEQVEKEKQHQLQESTFKFLSSVSLESSIIDVLKSHQLSNATQLVSIAEQIKERMLSDINTDSKDFTFVQKLASTQEAQVLSMADKITNFDVEHIIEAIDIRKTAQQVTTALNEKLRHSMPDDVVSNYLENLERVNKQIIETEKEITAYQAAINSNEELLPKVEDEKKRLYNQLKEATQGQNIYELTSSMNTMLSNFLEQCSLNKINQLKVYFMENFNLLFRKKHFIDAIDIDTNFNISVYRNRTYSYGDLGKLITNLGETEFAKSVGPHSLQMLRDHFSLPTTATVKDIQSQIQNLVFFGETIALQERINLQQLSKGEKQIYVLSLYWALIKLSAHEVPFVIDTPYARIDTEHRENITKEFLPHIGHQVIVLSTNEEINANYYNMLKPHIAQEYLLVFDTKQKKTEIYNKYFYEV